jgi:hypothetical protein
MNNSRTTRKAINNNLSMSRLSFKGGKVTHLLLTTSMTHLDNRCVTYSGHRCVIFY